MIDLTIAIVGHQRCQMLAECLNSIVQYTQGITYEVCVVDNASTDGTSNMIRKQFPQVRLFVNSNPRTFAENHNFLLRRAWGKYVLLLNDDTYLTQNAFRIMLEFLDVHPEVGAVGCRQCGAQGQFRPSAGNFPTLWNTALWACGVDRLAWVRAHWRTRIITWAPFYEQTRPVDWLSGACLLVKRSVALELGGLDETWGMNNEDIDLCYRMWQAGYQVYHIASAAIVHYGQGGDALSRKHAKWTANVSLLAYFRKHHPALLLWVRRILLLGAGLRIVAGWLLRHVKTKSQVGQELFSTYLMVWKVLQEYTLD